MTGRQTSLLVAGLAVLGVAVALVVWWPAADAASPRVQRADPSPRFTDPPVLDVPEPSEPSEPALADESPARDAVPAEPAEAPPVDSELAERERALTVLDTTLARLRNEMAAQYAAGEEVAASRSRTRIHRMTVVRATRARELEAMRAGE